MQPSYNSESTEPIATIANSLVATPFDYVIDFISVVRGVVPIGVGTGGAKGAMAPHFSAKIILKIFPLFLKHNFYTENDSSGRGKHKSA